jgi:hypothetical protein
MMKKSILQVAKQAFKKAELLLRDYDTANQVANDAYHRAISITMPRRPTSRGYTLEEIMAMTSKNIVNFIVEGKFYNNEMTHDQYYDCKHTLIDPLSSSDDFKSIFSSRNFRKDWTTAHLNITLNKLQYFVQNPYIRDLIIAEMVQISNDAVAYDVALASANAAVADADQAAGVAADALINPVALHKFLNEQFKMLYTQNQGGKMSRRKYNNKKKSYNKFNRR